MSVRIQGKNVFAQILIGGVYYPVFCAKGATLISSQDAIETTSVNSGPDREYVPGMRSHRMEANGITTSDNSNGRISIVYLMQAAQRRQTFDMRWLMTDDDANVVSITFSAFSTDLSISRDIGSFSQSSASFQITGGLVIGAVVPPPEPPDCEIEDTIYIDAVGGETSVSDPLLEQDDVVILWVSRETSVFKETTGTPGNAEFKFTGGAGNGTISFDTTNPLNAGEVIAISYKIAP